MSGGASTRTRPNWSTKLAVTIVLGLVCGVLAVAEVVLSPSIPAAQAQVPPTMSPKAIATTNLADAPIACGGGEVEAKWSNEGVPRQPGNGTMGIPPMYAYVYVAQPVASGTQFSIPSSVTIDSGQPSVNQQEHYLVHMKKVSGAGVNWALMSRGVPGASIQTRTSDAMSPELHRIEFYGFTKPPEVGQQFHTGTTKITIPTSLAAPCPGLGDGEACGCSASMPGVGDTQGAAADPVLTRNGTFYEDVEDFNLGGREPLSLQRRYISSRGLSEDGVGFGPGWTHSWMGSLNLTFDFSGDRRVQFQEESGASIMFYKYEGASGQNGKYRGLPMVTSWVERIGNEYHLYRDGGETLVFDSSGRLTAQHDGLGRTTTITYSGGEIDKVTDSKGRFLAFTWGDNDQGRRITKVEDSAGRSVSYGYSAQGDLTQVTDVGGNRMQYEYDAHRITRIRHPKQANQATPPTNKDVVNTYDGATARVLTQTDSRYTPSRTTTFDYTSIANSTKVTDPKGNVTVDEYNAAGQRVRSTRGWGTAAAVTYTYSYDSATQFTTQLHYRLASQPENQNQLAFSRQYDRDGNLLMEHDATLSIKRWGNYDTFFNVPGFFMDPMGTQTDYVWLGSLPDSISTPSIGTGPGGTDEVRVADYQYESYDYDLEKIVDPRGKEWLYDFDTYGFPLWSQDPVGNRTTFEYDSVGRIQSTVAPKGNKVGGVADDYRTTFVTDAYGAVTKATSPIGSSGPGVAVIERSFDPNRNLAWSKDANLKTTTYVTGDGNEVTTVQRPSGGNLQNSYYPDGSLQTQVDGAGAVTTYTYDPLGRLETTKTPDNCTTKHTYHASGNVATKRDPGSPCNGIANGQTTTFGYDPAGRLKTVAYGGGTTPNITNIVYDAAGRRQSMTQSAGGTGTSSWTWDSLGQMRTSKGGDDQHPVTYDYDLAGNLTEIVYPGNRTAVRHFDDASRLDSVTDWNAKTTSFHPDENSNYDSITYPAGTNSQDTFTFDRADRLMGIAYKQSGTDIAALTYGRQANGNLQSTATTGATLAHAPASENYQYDNIDRLTNVGANTYSFDNADNLTKLTDGTKQRFNNANQLCHTTPAAGADVACGTNPLPTGSTRFTYDDRGNRTSAVPATGATTNFAYDQVNRLTEVSGFALGNAGQYTAVTPNRVYDSRPTSRGGQAAACVGTCPKFNPGEARSVQITGGTSGVPAGAAAVVVNLTVAGGENAGFISAYPTGTPDPGVSNLNYLFGEARSNSAIVKLSADGKIDIKNANNATNKVDIIIDVQGWYGSPSSSAGATYNPITPARAFDSRGPYCFGNCGVLQPGESRIVTVAGIGSVPAGGGFSSVSVNLTAVNGTQAGNLTVAAAGATIPATAPTSLLYGPSAAVAELNISAVDAQGRIQIKNTSSGTVDVIVDVSGYNTATTTTGSGFTALTPERIYDSRVAQGCVATALTPCGQLANNAVRTIQVAGVNSIPADASAVVINLTGGISPSGGDGLLRAYPAGGTIPSVSTLNFVGNPVANMAIVKLNAQGQLAIQDQGASTDIVIDVQGYYQDVKTTRYAYDGDGLRQQRAYVGVPPTRFTWDHASGGLPQLLMEDGVDGSSAVFYLYGPGGLPYAQVAADGTTTYLRHDQLGSTRIATDATGGVVASWSYTPFGKISGATGNFLATHMLYTGQYFDWETNNYYLRARYYDPSTGQFISRDPIASITRSPYGYVYGSPLNGSDPSGLWCINVWDQECREENVSDYAALALNTAFPRTNLGEYARENTVSVCTSQFAGFGMGASGSLCVGSSRLRQFGFSATGSEREPLGSGDWAGYGAAAGLSLNVSDAQDFCELGGQANYVGADTPVGGIDYGWWQTPDGEDRHSMGIGAGPGAGVHGGLSSTKTWTFFNFDE